MGSDSRVTVVVEPLREVAPVALSGLSGGSLNINTGSLVLFLFSVACRASSHEPSHSILPAYLPVDNPETAEMTPTPGPGFKA